MTAYCSAVFPLFDMVEKTWDGIREDCTTGLRYIGTVIRRILSLIVHCLLIGLAGIAQLIGIVGLLCMLL